MTNEMFAQHIAYLIFFFALGASVGSFLNVVVWRLPRGESLSKPPSHCPKCNTPLAWYDNIPVFGWLALRGKCRYCREPISARYPIVEAAGGVLFALYYFLFFIEQIGPCSSRPLMLAWDWPIFGLYLFTLAALLAASLIDAELFIIPPEIPWWVGVMGVIVHTIVDRPGLPGGLNLSASAAALSLGATVGLGVSIGLWYFGIIPTSFPQGEPLLDVDREMMLKEMEQAKREGKVLEYPVPPAYTAGAIRMEMMKEVMFLLPPSLLGLGTLAAATYVPAMHDIWISACSHHWLTGFLGSCLGGLIGAFVVWITRILGTLGFGRVAMGLGDVHLMLGVGAVIGAGAATVAFFLAPFFGLLIAVYFMITKTRRELPYGPYLSLATAFVMLMYCPIAAYLTPGMQGLSAMLGNLFTP
ncbi:MAG TPA: prepilin peptidase [Tepidisphaeraceae bacterium]|jgi:leader peptidase (prepilin peptidase)/N-methyltransferase|nr:prepilin peptidase [Tepidisphaeraceae bacterium]